MNSFINQGRCRVCGQMFCCSKHQKHHENIHHNEYRYLLEKLPITCRKCGRKINFVNDLHGRCHPFMNPILMNGHFMTVSWSKSYRKRPLKEINQNDHTLIEKNTSPSEQRKILIPAHKFKKINLESFLSNTDMSTRILLFEFNQMAFDSKVMSPPLNISYKFVTNGILKSSTPLNEEEKQNSSIICEKSSVEESTYATPEIIQNSIVIISSSKKNTPPGIITNFSKRLSRNFVKNRKVYFELDKSPGNGEVSVYSTPTSTMEVINEIDEKMFEVDVQESSGCLLIKMMKKMTSAIHEIPKSISSVWSWNSRRLRKRRVYDEQHYVNSESFSPSRKKPRFESHDFLLRKPLSSYWVNVPVSSLVRKPLPNYIEKFDNKIEIC